METRLLSIYGTIPRRYQGINVREDLDKSYVVATICGAFTKVFYTIYDAYGVIIIITQT